MSIYSCQRYRERPDRRESRVLLVRRSELALPTTQLAGWFYFGRGKHTWAGVIIGIVIRTWVGGVTLLVVVVSALLQPQAQSKRTEDDSNRRPHTPFRAMFTALGT